MKFYALIAVIIAALSLQNCGDGPANDKNLFSISIKGDATSFTPEDEVTVSITNSKNKVIDSVAYFMNDGRLAGSVSGSTNISLAGQKLGQRPLLAKVYSEGNTFEATKTLNILSSITPKLYTYEIVETYPHDIEAYTQGLEFHNDTLYEGTGLYKESTLRKTNYVTGEVLQKIPLADTYFGEGITILGDRLLQLTWKENTGFIYKMPELEQTGTFVYGTSKQGWGLCNDGSKIYKSDGTSKIWTLNPGTLSEEGYIEIYTNRDVIDNVNELEWVEGKIYANIWERDAIAIVDPASGAVEGVIDLTGLQKEVTQHGSLDVLNGIAYNGEKDMLFVTGKRWDKLFKIKVVPK